ncbi:hypothetical protein CSB45_12775 [candidate division KSB3 bacterium]|uniref:DUF4143 domain-containing protein n=1 Tax=candidate division KSB3 bacterium TaxID=2044937 RepID=A0A2G6E1Z1_9BACT|nr:MAG: hypothetical protein CSB45_12775 [candidate division KSB3 bacterium]PIE28781.1 MAG: hypothetical protein CSA57_12170 [candidate division KSB3 bacterium]
MITFPNDDRHELDVFFLLSDQTPICIECKSGEFRGSIEKYTKLRRRLNIASSNFLIITLGLNTKQTQGLSSMYKLTFLNENNFGQYVAKLIARHA